MNFITLSANALIYAWVTMQVCSCNWTTNLQALTVVIIREHRGVCTNDFPDVVCRGNYSLHTYDLPLLYNLHSDPGEIYNLDPKSTEYTGVMTEIHKVS